MLSHHPLFMMFISPIHSTAEPSSKTHEDDCVNYVDDNILDYK